MESNRNASQRDRAHVAVPTWGAFLLAAAALLAGIATPARAADEDLPGRVGRVAEFAGQLFLSPEDRATEWQSIGLNYPVASGDNLWVGGPEGRAEVDYGGGQFRLAGETNLHVSRLDENRIALFLAQGTLVVRIRTLDPGDSARVDTPNTQVELRRPGLYRIDVTPDRLSTSVVVREGEALAALVNGAQQALPGQTLTVRGADPMDAIVVNGTAQDAFDTWSASRDRWYERPRNTAYVSRQMVGYADLDEYGTWQSTPEYGAVWYPTSVAPGWAPYRDGYWTEVGGWGLTWVDAAPWGYAPFHYGRWNWIGGRWGWAPGAYVARPIWAPALVGWYGGLGWGLSLSVGAPAYGWVPLAWGEPFTPWWRRCSYNCWATYNRHYAVDVRVRPTAPPSHYRHLGVPGAATVVSGSTIARRLPVAGNQLQAAPQYLSAPPVLTAAPAVPSGPNRIPGARPGTAGTPPPASTFYPTSRPGRLSIEAGPRPPATTPAPGVLPGTTPGTQDFNRGRDVRPAPVAPSGTVGTAGTSPTARPGTIERPRPVTPPATQPATPPGTIERSRPVTPPAVQPGTIERPRPTTPSATQPGPSVVPPMQAVPPASAGQPAAPSRGETTPRPRSPQRDATVPPASLPPPQVQGAPVARPSPAPRPQQPPMERGGSIPPPQVVPRGTPPPAPPAPQAAPAQAQPAPRGEQGRQAPKADAGNPPPAKP